MINLGLLLFCVSFVFVFGGSGGRGGGRRSPRFFLSRREFLFFSLPELLERDEVRRSLGPPITWVVVGRHFNCLLVVV